MVHNLALDILEGFVDPLDPLILVDFHYSYIPRISNHSISTKDSFSNPLFCLPFSVSLVVEHGWFIVAFFFHDVESGI